MRISDWSSDVCSSDLGVGGGKVAGEILCEGGTDRRWRAAGPQNGGGTVMPAQQQQHAVLVIMPVERPQTAVAVGDRTSVEEGTSVAARVALGGRRIMKTQQR